MQRSLPSAPSADASLAETRLQFLTAGSVEPSQVRDAILASWWRSRQSNVAADHIDLQYNRDPDLDTPLIRSAEPVLRHLAEQLDGGHALSIILTDPSGMVLTRLTADAALERRLDAVHLVPGMSYAEDRVGTNGIGTALESGRPMHVFGHEHYAESLDELACAAVPIRHPISGKTVGALDLTCWRKDAGPLLVTLAKTTAEQVRQALLTETGMREIELLHEYLRACRRSAGMVFGLNNDVVMMNETARSTLSPADQDALLRYAADGMTGRQESVEVDLPTGMRVRMHTRVVTSAGRVAGGVVDVKVVEPGGGSAVELAGPAARMILPGLIGTGMLWRRACVEVERVCRTGDWLVVEGEEGSGRLSILRAVHQRTHAAGRFTVLDGAEARDARWLVEARRSLSAEDGTVVLRHLEVLDQATLRSLSGAVAKAAEERAVRVLAIVRSGESTAELARLLRMFPTTVGVPPLRHHIEDVQLLVPFLLMRLGHGGQLTCSSEAMQLLMRFSWPGNVGQLLDVLRRVVQTRRTGVIQASDIPAEAQTLSRRRLSTLESMERDAIVRVLIDSGGNKTRAARALGLSRATIYRKIHEYGVVTPAEVKALSR
ncbi:MAG: GAF domain-containing protein [Geodermatophilaceae bacterium]|nr:GAF domain-containing protein [Geodermatophilaceae bacterium]